MLLGTNDGYRTSPSSSGRSTPFFDGGVGKQRSADELESQNDDRLEGLGNKVKMLKDVRAFALQEKDAYACCLG